MSSSLYQKYRPQTFDELVGQNHIKTILENQIKTDRINHAYLFSGPRGIGKTTCARLLAKIVNCQNRKKNEIQSCNQCAACKEINNGKSLDILEIDAASQTGVDNVRENIIENSRFAPYLLKYKIFIIDEVHMLSLSAFNALLKIIEEPPTYVIFILATTEIHKIPKTIISRCQQFNFKKITFSETVERLSKLCCLEKIKVDLQVLKNIAYQSQGYLRDAESLLGQILVLGEKKISIEQAELIIPHSNFDLILKLLKYFFEKNKKEALILINQLVEQGIDLKYFINDCIEIMRKILLIKVNPELNKFSQEMDKEIEIKILNLAEKIETEKLSKAIQILIETQKELGENNIIQLPFEIATLEIINISNELRIINQENINISEQKNEEIKKQPIINNISSDIKISKYKNEEIKKNKIQECENTKIAGLKTLKHNPQINLDKIKKEWNNVLEETKKCNHSIFTFLKTAELVSFKENLLQIEFKHRFFQERINDRKNKEIIENILENILKQKIILKSEILSIENILSEENQDKFLDKILNAFDGKIIE
ncbi:MAG: DNA polymerase III subunit gamma/tau [Patescibacteria group bacterium]